MRYLFFIPIIFTASFLHAQESNIVGEVHTFYSDHLKEDRRIQVYLPSDYEGSEKSFPTLYILDGDWFFLNGVAMQQNLRGENLLPEMIVIGIEMDRPYRDEVFSDKWNEFIDFLEQDLVGYVDKTFRTKDERILFGWENSGFLVSEVILKSSDVFDGAIASNGAYISDELIASFDSLDQTKYLYLANTQKDIYTVQSSQKAAEVLRKGNSKNLIWTYEEFNDEIHESLGYLSMYHGLKFFYHNFGSPAFSSIEDFSDRGGMPFLKKYFEERGKRFGLPKEVDKATKNTLIWMAWNHDNFDAFDLFMTEFEAVLSTDRYASAYWQNRLAQFYLKYNSLDNAITFFERGIEEYPDKDFLAEMHSGLAKVLSKKGDNKTARKHMKKAIEIAKNNDDPKEEAYRSELVKMK